MKVTIAMDSFKGSMTSLEAGTAVKNGILNSQDGNLGFPQPTIIPVADGGEGTLEALTFGKSVTRHTLTVTGPLGEPVQASYIMVGEDSAIIEMAEAAGLTLVPEHLRNPLYTTTYGVGELINHAIKQGCIHFIVGIGGSATNDGGIGMLQALGYNILNNDLKNVPFGAVGLSEVARISPDISCDDKYTSSNNYNKISDNTNPTYTNLVSSSDLTHQLAKCDFTIACDVDNPLVGERGCSRIFAPQKGATPEMVEDMDRWMNHYADVVEEMCREGDDSIAPTANTTTPNRFTLGAGAAGGLGYAFLMFLGAKLMSGADIVISKTNLEEHVKSSDLVIVGEGKMDAQSLMGKIPFTIAKLAKKYNKRVIAYAGVVEDREALEAANVFDSIFAIDKGTMPIGEAMKTSNAINNLERTVKNTILP